MKSPRLLVLMLGCALLLVSATAPQAPGQLEKKMDKRGPKTDFAVSTSVTVAGILAAWLAATAGILGAPVTGGGSAIIGLSLASAILTTLGGGAIIGRDAVQMYKEAKASAAHFTQLVSKLNAQQKLESWAHYDIEKSIEKAWEEYQKMHNAISKANPTEEGIRAPVEEFKKHCAYYSRDLLSMLEMPGKSFQYQLGDMIEEHIQCREPEIKKVMDSIFYLMNIGFVMNMFCHGLEGKLTEDDIYDEVELIYAANVVMLNIHKACMSRSMLYVTRHIETLMGDGKIKVEALPKIAVSYLTEQYGQYHWMVVAFKGKIGKNKRALTGFTKISTTSLILRKKYTVAVARQVVGNQDNEAEIQKAIESCFKDLPECVDVPNTLRKCNAKVAGKTYRMGRIYTAVHAYVKEPNQHTTAVETEMDAFLRQHIYAQSKVISKYTGKCKRSPKTVLGMPTGNDSPGEFVVMFKSWEEISREHPCDKKDCGAKEGHGYCVTTDTYMAICECQYPYHGENCEESIDDFVKKLVPYYAGKASVD